MKINRVVRSFCYLILGLSGKEKVCTWQKAKFAMKTSSIKTQNEVEKIGKVCKGKCENGRMAQAKKCERKKGEER